jgi:uncharacterized protein YwlG (UPF0340 family)
MDRINNADINSRIHIVSNAQRNANTILLLYKMNDELNRNLIVEEEKGHEFDLPKVD